MRTQDSKFKGSILLFRNDEDANPVAFTVSVPASLAQTLSTSRLTRGCGQIADYEAMKKSQAAKAESGEEGAAAASAEAEEEEEDESSEEDSEEEDLSEDQKAMLEAVISNFTEMKGRPPTEIELVAIMNSLNARIMEQDEDDDSDVDEDELRAEVDGKDDEEDDDIDAVEEEEGASKAAAAAPAGPKTRRASTLPTPSPRCATPFHPCADGPGGSGGVSWLSVRAAVGQVADEGGACTAGADCAQAATIVKAKAGEYTGREAQNNRTVSAPSTAPSTHGRTAAFAPPPDSPP